MLLKKSWGIKLSAGFALSVLLSTFLHLERAGPEKFQESRSFSQPVSPRSGTIVNTLPARIGSQGESLRPAPLLRQVRSWAFSRKVRVFSFQHCGVDPSLDSGKRLGSLSISTQSKGNVSAGRERFRPISVKEASA
jgi:hypothetical protein